MAEDGTRMLLKYDATYNAEGDLRLLIDREILEEKGDGCLNIVYIPDDDGRTCSRSINLQIDSSMW